jgi:hypothetical protein
LKPQILIFQFLTAALFLSPSVTVLAANRKNPLREPVFGAEPTVAPVSEKMEHAFMDVGIPLIQGLVQETNTWLSGQTRLEAFSNHSTIYFYTLVDKQWQDKGYVTKKIAAKADFGVVEFEFPPDTIQNLESAQDHLQALFYDIPEKLGLRPDPLLGQGHVQISLKSFRSVRHLQNFIADFLNHSELASGIWEHDYRNSNAITNESEDRQLQWKLFTEMDIDMNVKDFIKKHTDHAGVTRVNLPNQDVLYFLPKTDSITFNFANNSLEIRANRAFKSIADMLTVFKILRHRIKLTDVPEKIVFNPHKQKTAMQMIVSYFGYVGNSVPLEDARRLIGGTTTRFNGGNLLGLSFEIFERSREQIQPTGGKFCEISWQN